MPVQPPDPSSGIPFRLYGLEGQVKTQDGAITNLREITARHSEAIGAQAVTLASHEEQLKGGARDMTEVKTDVAALAVSVTVLAEKVALTGSRIAWTFAGSTLALTAMLAGYIITGH